MSYKLVDGLKFFIALSVLMISGCGQDMYPKREGKTVKGYPKLVSTENRNIKFFQCSENFEIPQGGEAKISEFLKEVKGDGRDNISFTIISNKQLSSEVQEKIRETVQKLMYKEGFIQSRIVDSGVCVYREATPGIRIDALDYTLTDPDVSEWDDPIGDCDVAKQAPRFGHAGMYNLSKMIANKADISNPRTYRGQATADAISAISSGSSGG